MAMTCLLSCLVLLDMNWARLFFFDTLLFFFFFFATPSAVSDNPLITLISSTSMAELPVRDNFVVGHAEKAKIYNQKSTNVHAYMCPSPDLACGPDNQTTLLYLLQMPSWIVRV